MLHPNFKDGEHTNELYLGILKPERGERFQERTKQKRRVLTAEIAMAEVRAEEILREIESGEYISRSDLRKMAEAVSAAQMEQDYEKALDACNALIAALRQGEAQERGWQQFDEIAWRRKPSLLLAEAKLNLLTQEVYQKRSVVQLMDAVAALVKRHVKDLDEADAIYRGLLRLTGGGGTGRVLGEPTQAGRRSDH